MLVPVERIAMDRVAPASPRSVVICGATGSIGQSALELARSQPGQFSVVALTAQSNAARLHALALEHRPKYVGLVDANAADDFLRLPKISGCELVTGERDVAALAAVPEADTVLAAVVGVAGLRSVEAALRAGKRVALANKESLVAAGTLVRELQQRSGAVILPVDSEHSALFQCLLGNDFADVDSLVLTASGGPFRNLPAAQFPSVTPEQAVKHPRWNMGAKISVDSATLMNKALELIEAHWLFGVSDQRIEVIVHPESIVHSLVRYSDGNLMAQLSNPDMKGPISFALAYPWGRVPGAVSRLDLATLGSLHFEALDREKFPFVDIARTCIREGGNRSLVFNTANEVAVAAFLRGELRFDRIFTFVQKCVEKLQGAAPVHFEELYGMVEAVRSSAAEMLR